MSRMTDEEFEFLETLDLERVLTGELVDLVDRLRKALKAERQRVVGLEEIIRTDPDYAPWAKLAAAEARVAELEQERDAWKNTACWADVKRQAAEARIEKLVNLFTYEDDGRRYSNCRSDTDVTDSLMEALGD